MEIHPIQKPQNKTFHANVESVLLYKCETWTITTKISKALDGCYSRMLRPALNVDWKTHMTNKELYSDTLQITTKIKARRQTFAGHCERAEGCRVSKLVTWRPTKGIRSKGRPKKTYVDLLKEVENSMQNRRLWRATMPDSKSRLSE